VHVHIRLFEVIVDTISVETLEKSIKSFKDRFGKQKLTKIIIRKMH
jgi:hypothetical protein